MDAFSTSSLQALLPAMTTTLPGVGAVDVAAYVLAAGVFIVLSVVFKLVQLFVVRHLKTLSTKTNTDVDDVVIGAIDGIRAWVYTLVALYVALQFVVIPTWLDLSVSALTYFAIVWQAIEIAVQFVDYGVQRFVEKDEDGDGVIDPGAATASGLITLMARILFWALGGLFVLSNLGIEITSLIAGLGIGGIAVAFALQGILSDLFASFSIYFDRPFRVGDYIVIGTDSGVVEKIGIKSTRLKTLQGEELVVSNAELTTARVNNFKKMEERRIVTQIGVTYDTPQAQVAEIPGIVTRIFEALDGGRLDRVHFTTFGDSALIFDIVYYVESADYTQYLTIQQRFNLDLMQRFAELNIEFAYPTQTVYHKQIS